MISHDELYKQKQQYEIKQEHIEEQQQNNVAFQNVQMQQEMNGQNMEPAEIPEEPQYQFEKKHGKKLRGKKVPNYVLKNKRKKLQLQTKENKLNLIDEKLNATFAEFDEKLEDEKENIFGTLHCPSMSEMERQHEAVTETIVKQHTFKKDEVITRTVVKDKETKVSQKKAIAKRMKLYTDEMDITKVKARAAVDINDKKLLDYHTFEQLSEFVPLLGKDESLSKLCSSYGKAKQRYKGNLDSKNEENAEKVYREDVCPVLDTLTVTIMKIDASSLKLTPDGDMVQNASELESMSRALSAYMGLIEKEPKYKEYLFSKKTKDGNGTWGDRVLKQLDRLSAISEYYRLRRIVIEDEYYMNHANEEIPLQEEKNDTIALKRLKKNMRASVMAAGNLSRIFGDVDVAIPIFKDSDMAGIMIKNSYENKEKDEKKRLQAANRHFDRIFGQDKYVRDMEKERYLQPPLWLQNSLTMDTEQIKKPKINKEAGYGAGAANTDVPMLNNYLKKTGRLGLLNRINEMRVQKTKTNHWGDSPKFSGKDKSLSKITISDHWDRCMWAYSTEYSYLRTDDEMLEMMDILSLQMDAEKWAEIQKDPQAVAFYESAYREMAMKNVSIIYSSARRMSETIMGKFLSLHTADLVQQMNTKIRSVIMNNAVISNITTPDNVNLLDKLFKENDPEGRYYYDKEGLLDMNGLAPANMRLNYVGGEYGSLLMKSTEFDDSGDEEKIEIAKKARIKIFGDDDFLENTIKPEYEENRKSAEKEGFPHDDKGMISWYLIHHPEYMTVEKMNTKIGDTYIFQDSFVGGLSALYCDTENEYRNMITKKKIDLPSSEEMDNYEQSLKDRNLCAMRADNSLDPEDPDTDVKIGKTGLTIKQKEISKNRKKDPYGLNLVRNGLKELFMKDENGKTIMRSGKGQI